MPKAWLLLIICVVLLASCNLPVSQPTNTPDIVATQVSMLLTSQPSPQPLIPTSTDQSNLNLELSATPTLTNTPEPTQTPTASPDDPGEFLGPPDFIDTLDTGKSFGLAGQPYDDEYTSIRVENGSLILTSKYATGYRGWRTGGTQLINAYIEAPMRVSDCSGNDTYGLVYRSPDYIKGYWFQLTCDGNWFFGYWDGTNYVNLKDGTSEAILTGSNQINRVGVMVSGTNHKLYVNGKPISEVVDSTFTDAGSFGAVIAAFSTPNFTVSISEFAYWNIQ